MDQCQTITICNQGSGCAPKKDFIEIHESTVSYGSPELEDQNSGAIYMHASIHEDKSSKGKICF